MAETGLAMRALPFMICPECIELLGSWARASDRLCQQTALLSALVASGDQCGFDHTFTLVEDIRLQGPLPLLRRSGEPVGGLRGGRQTSALSL